MKKVLRLMAVAIVALSSLCACNDCDCEPPYMDDPVEVAEKTKILSDYLAKREEVKVCINNQQQPFYGTNYDEFHYHTKSFLSSQVRIEGQLIYFGTELVLRVVQFTNISSANNAYMGEIIFFSTK